MIEIFNKNKKKVDDFFTTAEVCSLTVFGSVKEKYPEESIWLFNPQLPLGVNTKIPIIVSYLTSSMSIAKPKMKSEILNGVSKYEGSEADLRSFSDYIIAIEDDMVGSPDEVLLIIGFHSGYWLGWAIEQEYKKDKQEYKFNDEFLQEVGTLIAKYALHICVPLIE